MVGPRRMRGRRSGGGSAGGMAAPRFAPSRSIKESTTPSAKTESNATAKPSLKAAREPIWTTKVVGDSVIVKSPYEPSLEKELEKLDGRWELSRDDLSKNVWVLPARHKDMAEKVLTKYLGANDEDLVDMRVKTDGLDLEYANTFRIGQYYVHRPSRDLSVQTSPNIAIVEGGFPQTGGSLRHPCLEPRPGTVLEVKGVPKSIAEKAKAKYGDNVEILK